MFTNGVNQSSNTSVNQQLKSNTGQVGIQAAETSHMAAVIQQTAFQSTNPQSSHQFIPLSREDQSNQNNSSSDQLKKEPQETDSGGWFKSIYKTAGAALGTIGKGVAYTVGTVGAQVGMALHNAWISPTSTRLDSNKRIQKALKAQDSDYRAFIQLRDFACQMALQACAANKEQITELLVSSCPIVTQDFIRSNLRMYPTYLDSLVEVNILNAFANLAEEMARASDQISNYQNQSALVNLVALFCQRANPFSSSANQNVNSNAPALEAILMNENLEEKKNQLLRFFKPMSEQILRVFLPGGFGDLTFGHLLNFVQFTGTKAKEKNLVDSTVRELISDQLNHFIVTVYSEIANPQKDKNRENAINNQFRQANLDIETIILKPANEGLKEYLRRYFETNPEAPALIQSFLSSQINQSEYEKKISGLGYEDFSKWILDSTRALMYSQDPHVQGAGRFISSVLRSLSLGLIAEGSQLMIKPEENVDPNQLVSRLMDGVNTYIKSLESGKIQEQAYHEFIDKMPIPSILSKFVKSLSVNKAKAFQTYLIKVNKDVAKATSAYETYKSEVQVQANGPEKIAMSEQLTDFLVDIVLGTVQPYKTVTQQIIKSLQIDNRHFDALHQKVSELVKKSAEQPITAEGLVTEVMQLSSEENILTISRDDAIRKLEADGLANKVQETAKSDLTEQLGLNNLLEEVIAQYFPSVKFNKAFSDWLNSNMAALSTSTGALPIVNPQLVKEGLQLVILKALAQENEVSGFFAKVYKAFNQLLSPENKQPLIPIIREITEFQEELKQLQNSQAAIKGELRVKPEVFSEELGAIEALDKLLILQTRRIKALEDKHALEKDYNAKREKFQPYFANLQDVTIEDVLNEFKGVFAFQRAIQPDLDRYKKNILFFQPEEISKEWTAYLQSIQSQLDAQPDADEQAKLMEAQKLSASLINLNTLKGLDDYVEGLKSNLEDEMLALRLQICNEWKDRLQHRVTVKALDLYMQELAKKEGATNVSEEEKREAQVLLESCQQLNQMLQGDVSTVDLISQLLNLPTTIESAKQAYLHSFNDLQQQESIIRSQYSAGVVDWMNAALDKKIHLNNLAHREIDLEKQLNEKIKEVGVFADLTQELARLIGMDNKQGLAIPSFLKEYVWPFIKSAKKDRIPRLLTDYLAPIALNSWDRDLQKATLKEKSNLLAGLTSPAAKYGIKILINRPKDLMALMGDIPLINSLGEQCLADLKVFKESNSNAYQGMVQILEKHLESLVVPLFHKIADQNHTQGHQTIDERLLDGLVNSLAIARQQIQNDISKETAVHEATDHFVKNVLGIHSADYLDVLPLAYRSTVYKLMYSIVENLMGSNLEAMQELRNEHPSVKQAEQDLVNFFGNNHAALMFNDLGNMIIESTFAFLGDEALEGQLKGTVVMGSALRRNLAEMAHENLELVEVLENYINGMRLQKKSDKYLRQLRDPKNLEAEKALAAEVLKNLFIRQTSQPLQKTVLEQKRVIKLFTKLTEVLGETYRFENIAKKTKDGRTHKNFVAAAGAKLHPGVEKEKASYQLFARKINEDLVLNLKPENLKVLESEIEKLAIQNQSGERHLTMDELVKAIEIAMWPGLDSKEKKSLLSIRAASKENFSSFAHAISQKLQPNLQEKQIETLIRKLEECANSQKIECKHLNINDVIGLVEGVLRPSLTSERKDALEAIQDDNQDSIIIQIGKKAGAIAATRQEKFYKRVNAKLMKLLFPRGLADIYFVAPQWRQMVWDLLENQVASSVMPLIVNSLIDRDMVLSMAISGLKNAQLMMTQPKGEGVAVAIDETNFTAMDQAVGELANELVDAAQLPSFANWIFGTKEQMKNTLGSALRQQATGTFLRDQLKVGIKNMAGVNDDGSIDPSQLRENAAFKADTRLSREKQDAANRLRPNKEQELLEETHKLIDLALNIPSQLLKDKWAAMQSKWDDFIHQHLGKIALGFKHALDAVFAFIVFKVVGTIIWILLYPLNALVHKAAHRVADKFIQGALEPFINIPKDQPQHANQNHATKVEHMAYRVLDELINVLEEEYPEGENLVAAGHED